MEKQKKKNNIIYIVIAVLTLIVAITGATFAYYTATSTINNVITGNMATIKFNISVAKKTNVDNTRGLIPMTNSMVQKAVSNASTKGICLDDNGNAVCQVYKITLKNSGSSSVFVTGTLTLNANNNSNHCIYSLFITDNLFSTILFAIVETSSSVVSPST